MAIPDSYRRYLDTLVRAAKADDLALMECVDAATGVTRYVLCAVGRDNGTYLMTSFGHLRDGDPLATYAPPTAQTGEARA